MFAPAKTVNTAEFLKMLTKTFNFQEGLKYDYQDTYDHDWFGRYAGIAQNYNLFPRRDSHFLTPSKELTRDEVAVAIWKVLIAPAPNRTNSTIQKSTIIQKDNFRKEKECSSLYNEISLNLEVLSHPGWEMSLEEVFYSPKEDACFYIDNVDMGGGSLLRRILKVGMNPLKDPYKDMSAYKMRIKDWEIAYSAGENVVQMRQREIERFENLIKELKSDS